MRSAGAPKATVLVVITLVFAPVLGHNNHWYRMLVGGGATTVSVPCSDGARCPAVAVVTEKVTATDASQAAVASAMSGSVTQGVADFLAGSSGSGSGDDQGDDQGDQGDNGNGKATGTAATATATTARRTRPARTSPTSPTSRARTARARTARCSSLMVVLAGLLLAFDFQNVLSWWRVRIVAPATEPSDDFTIIVPVFGHPRYFDGRAELAEYKANVLVALEVTPAIMGAFADALEAEGWRVGRYVRQPTRTRPRSCRPRSRTSRRRSRCVSTRTRGSRATCGCAAAAVIASGADLCSTKCEVSNRTNLVTKLQALEYRMAMLGRHIRPWLTSGACFIGRTDSLRTLYGSHSLWTPGEDIETGVVAKAMKMKVRHCDLVVSTDAPDTWLALAQAAAALVRGELPPLERQHRQEPLSTGRS